MGIVTSKCVVTERKIIAQGSEFPILFLKLRTSKPLVKNTKYIKMINCCTLKSYSPMDLTPEGFSLAVKLYTGGKMSEMFRAVQVGDTLSYFDPGKQKVSRKGDNVGVLALGIGITSALTTVERELADSARKQVVLLFANREKKDEVFLKRISDLEKKHHNFSYLRVLSRERAESDQDSHIHNGRLDKELLQSTFGSWDPAHSLFHVVGTKSQMSSVRQLLEDYFKQPISKLYE